MIKPTVGRVVWYRPAKGDMRTNGTDPLAAIVCAVHSDSYVTLSVFTIEGFQQPRQSVLLVQEGEPKPDDTSFCQWMPYQIGQAKKHEGA